VIFRADMPWNEVRDTRGQAWRINPDGFAQIIRSSIRNRALLRKSRTVTIPGALFWPDRVNYETDFNGLTTEVNREAERFVREGWLQANLQDASIFGSLLGLRSDALRDGEEYRRRSVAAFQQTQKNLNQAVDRGEAVVQGVMQLSELQLVL
jgi:hypothetical protein